MGAQWQVVGSAFARERVGMFLSFLGGGRGPRGGSQQRQQLLQQASCACLASTTYLEGCAHMQQHSNLCRDCSALVRNQIHHIAYRWGAGE